MKYFNVIACIMGVLCTHTGLLGQNTDGGYFDFSYEIRLPSSQEIDLLECSNSTVALVSGDTLLLSPPDMAKIGKDRIMAVSTDTIWKNHVPMKCLSTCQLDTLFIADDLFVSPATVYVPFFVDGTYDDESRFGYDILSSVGTVMMSGVNRSGGPAISVENINPKNLTIEGRLRMLQSMAPGSNSGFPFAQDAISSIRLIRANGSDETRFMLNTMHNLFIQQPIFCGSTSVDPNIPPASAVNRLNSKITVRFFEPFHAERAYVLGDCIAYLFQVPLSDIHIEDMLQFYNGVPPIRDYMEVWFN